MRCLHLVIGLLGIVLFLISGLYMHFGLGHLRGLDNTTRLLFRSGHIYLLFSALVNVSLGLYLHQAPMGWRRWLQSLGSLLILLAVPLLSTGFLLEPWLTELDRPYARLAIYGSLAGIVLHLLSHWRRQESASVNGVEPYNHQ